MPRFKMAKNLKVDNIVDVMGLEYIVKSVEKDTSDIDIWLEPTDVNNPAFITINLHPKAKVHTK